MRSSSRGTRFLNQALQFLHANGLTHGSLNLRHFCFTRTGKLKLRVPAHTWFACPQRSKASDHAVKRDYQTLGAVVYNCVFNERLEGEDHEAIRANLRLFVRLSGDPQRASGNALKDYTGQNRLAPLIARNVDPRLLALLDALLDPLQTDPVKFVDLSALHDLRDLTFKNDLSFYELMSTMRAQESSFIKNPELTERRISTKFSKELLKKSLGDLVGKLQELLGKEMPEEKRSLFKNWLFINERTPFVKEVAESLGVSRRLVCHTLKAVVHSTGLDAKIKAIKSSQ